MTIQEMLQADGLSTEEIATLTGNPKYVATLEKMRQKAEGGETALLNAKQIEENLKKFNQETVIPYGLKKDQEAAKATAELAKTQAYLKSLKDSGYDIPDDYLSAAPPATVTATTTTAAHDYSGDILGAAQVNMELISLSNKYRKLTGDELDPVDEYSDFGKNKRPGETLRGYIDRKYDLGAKQAAKDAERQVASEKKIADAAIEKYKAEHPMTADPDRATPRPTKFDRLANLDKDRKQMWQTAEGREKATKDRIAKYAGMVN
jgi:hypothetical protein